MKPNDFFLPSSSPVTTVQGTFRHGQTAFYLILQINLAFSSLNGFLFISFTEDCCFFKWNYKLNEELEFTLLAATSYHDKSSNESSWINYKLLLLALNEFCGPRMWCGSLVV